MAAREWWWKRLGTASQLVVGVCWIWAGLSKILAPAAFEEALTAHGVFDIAHVDWLVIGVPATEGALGTALLVLGSRRLPTVFIAAASALLLVALTYYIMMVPEEVLRKSGCGCMGMPRGTEQSDKWALVRNVALLALHPMIPKGVHAEVSGGIRR